MSALQFEYDIVDDVLTIEGVRYSGELFRGLGALDVGGLFQIQDRKDGVLTLYEIDNAELRLQVLDMALQTPGVQGRDDIQFTAEHYLNYILKGEQ